MLIFQRHLSRDSADRLRCRHPSGFQLYYVRYSNASCGWRRKQTVSAPLNTGVDSVPQPDSTGSTLSVFGPCPETSYDLFLLPAPQFEQASRGSEPEQFSRGPFDESFGQISPNGKWILYMSDGPGQLEIYVISYPEPAPIRNQGATAVPHIGVQRLHM